MKRYVNEYSNPNIRRKQKGKPEMSEAERKLWSELRGKQMGTYFKRKVSYGPYILDFFSSEAKLVIEVNGKRHEIEKGRQKDEIRDAYLRKEGLTVLRFSGPEALANMNGVLQRIWLHLNKNINESQ